MFDHQTRSRDLSVRLAGSIMLGCAGLMLRWLVGSVHLHPQHDAAALEAFAAAAGFLCLGGGALLTVLGHHVFDRVEIAERWASTPPDADRGPGGRSTQSCTTANAGGS